MRTGISHIPAAGLCLTPALCPDQTEPMNANYHFLSSDAPEAIAARDALAERYGQLSADKADVLVALGGDGFMLQTIHGVMGKKTPIYGMNRGSVGFLMNDYALDNLEKRIAEAKPETITPLRMKTEDVHGEIVDALAINEVSLFRQSYQAAKIRITVDSKIRMDELVCDGVMVATPAGSTAYNLSAHGPIIPLDAPLLALTPVSPYRPRRWRGALLPDHVCVTLEILEHRKRPVNAVADHTEVKSVRKIEIEQAREITATVLFDATHSWDERILAEQFKY